MTLFDYISDQEIIELQRQADDEIGEIEVNIKAFPFFFSGLHDFLLYIRPFIIRYKIKQEIYRPLYKNYSWPEKTLYPSLSVSPYPVLLMRKYNCKKKSL